MSRFYVRPEDVRGNEILVSREEAHHIVDVMRMRAGDNIVAFDGTGKEYIGKILYTSKTSLKIRIEKIDSIKKENKISIILAQTIPKKAKMDFIIEKATELGVSEIMPVISERTIVRLDEDKRQARARHWQNIAISASKQCGRVDVPKINPVLKFNEVLKEVRNYDLAMMACLDNSARPIGEVISNSKGREILVMVGPEGDFTPEEIAAAKSSGVKLISLGRLVLRVDTAALFVLSVLRYYESNIQDIRL